MFNPHRLRPDAWFGSLHVGLFSRESGLGFREAVPMVGSKNEVQGTGRRKGTIAQGLGRFAWILCQTPGSIGETP